MFTASSPALPAGLVLLGLLSLPCSASAAPPRRGLLLRADASVAPGHYIQTFDSGGTMTEHQDFSGVTLGPALALNLGLAPTKLVRLGLSAGAHFGMNLEEAGSMSSVDQDGIMRWTLGPTVGFRFGPRLPIELELGLALSHMMVFGSQTSNGFTPTTRFEIGAKQYGTVTSALFIWRPGGADSVWGLHAGLNGGWGYSSLNGGEMTTFVTTSLLGLSVGL